MRRIMAAIVVLVLSLTGCMASDGEVQEPSLAETELARVPTGWPSAAHDLAATNSNPDEVILDRRSVRRLAVDWVFDEQRAGLPVRPIHAPAIVDDAGSVYVGDLGGTFYAIDGNGALTWSFQADPPTAALAALVPPELGGALASPIVGAAALARNRPYVVVADANGRIYARQRETGEEVWTARDVDPHPLGGVAGNALMVVGDTVLVGLSSLENYAFVLQSAGLPIQCCTHQGALVALSLETGALLWRYDVVEPAQMLPESAAPFVLGPSGGGIWAPPSYDPESKTVYVSTGQNLSPNAEGRGTSGTDAIIALDIQDGTPRWVRQLTQNDVWALGVPNPNPVTGAYVDMDVGDAPKIYRLPSGRKVVGAGQKDGRYHVLDAKTGEVVRSTQHIAPRNDLGGFQTGGAVAHGRVFQHGLDATDGFTTCNEGPCAYEGFDGVVVALTLSGASKRWTLRIPGSPLVGGLAVANRVVYFQSPVEESAPLQDPPSWGLYAVDADRGTILKRLVFEGRAVGSPVVAGGHVYATAGNAALQALGIDPKGALYRFTPSEE